MNELNYYGRAAVSEFLGNNIIYRNLIPVNPEIPGLPEIWEEAGLSSIKIPRKTTPEYAAVVAFMLKYIANQNNPRSPIERVVFIGDTHLNDGMAFQNICRAGDWFGMAFIAAERSDPFEVEMEKVNLGTIVLANRWTALKAFEEYCSQEDFHVDTQTAVLLDLDKTTLGARGRNDKVIDQIRIEAANQTIRKLLGDEFDEQDFSTSYRCLNQPEFHPFTADNQDYLVYICMIIGSGLISLSELTADVKSEKMATFNQFLKFSEDNKHSLPLNLCRVHDDVFNLVNNGDPTPFKNFRQEEFRLTISRMGQLPADTPLEILLKEEIVITQEVRQVALSWREKGALLFGLSDKPDEASIPTSRMVSEGYRPIHQIETNIIGA